MSNNRTSHPFTHVERTAKNETVPAKDGQGFHSPVRIHIHSIRKRLTDADGVSAKAAIDGLVKAGVLEDDSPEFVQEVSYSQEKGKEEKTIITLEII